MAVVVASYSLPIGSFAQSFNHPGVLVNRAQLDLIKKKIADGQEPWKNAYTKAMASPSASLNYTAKPRATVECGSYSNPDYGCSDETNDAKAAYTHALLWQLNGNKAHAQKAIQIMNAWSEVLKTHTNSNSPLQAGWGGCVFVRAAEIIRHTDAGWSKADIDRFSDMLRIAFLPKIWPGWPSSNGNWDLTMIEAMVGMGVFLDSVPVFDHAVSMWRQRVPAYFYMTTDGDYPHPSPGSNQDTKAEIITYWQGQTVFKDGLAQETCRDFGHTQFGIASTINTAETARLQGVDLYGEESKRLTAGLEFHAGYLNGEPIPSWLCGGKLDLSNFSTWEIAYNHYHNRMTMALPKTEKLVAKLRPGGASLIVAWETLTHAETGGTATLPLAPILTVAISPSQPVRRQVQGIRVVFLAGQGILLQRPGKNGSPESFVADGKNHVLSR